VPSVRLQLFGASREFADHELINAFKNKEQSGETAMDLNKLCQATSTAAKKHRR
jgi:hypothetical protein